MTIAIHSADDPQLTKLEQYDLIEIKGDDALEFLHNQFTNDLKKLVEGSLSPSAWCSIKGRVLYTFQIWHQEKVFHLLLPSIQTESFLKKLKMYVFRSDVSIDLISDQFIYGLSGKDLEQLLVNIPKNEKSFTLKIQSSVEPRYLIISHNHNLEIGSLLATSEQDQLWQQLDIISGIPEILPDTADMFLPQMLNLEELGGLSFQKGCYPGQEIVARVKYRGQLKKQLYQIKIKTEHEVKPGMPFILSNNGSDQPIGHLINCSKTENDQWLALAVINIKEAESPDSVIRLQIDESSLCELKPLG